MNSDKENVVDNATQIIEVIVQSFAIIAVLITILLFMCRLIVCVYYRLPIDYNSLSLLRTIPIALIAMMVVLYCIGFYQDLRLKYSRRKQTAAENENTEDLFYETVLELTLLPKFIKKVLLRIRKKREEKRKIKNTNKNVNMYEGKKANRVGDIGDILELFWIPLLVCLTIAFYFPFSRHVIDHDIVVVLIFWGFVIFSITIISLIKIGVYLNNKIRDPYENTRIINEEQLKKRSSEIDIFSESKKSVLKSIIEGIIIFSIVASIVASIQLFCLISKNWCGIVEDTENDSQKYAIVLDLDEYYVLEPVSIDEDNSILYIWHGEYKYVSKDNVTVQRRRYDQVLVR